MQTENNSDHVARSFLTGSYKYRFLKNKSERWIELRANLGNTISYKDKTGFANSHYLMSMSGARGGQDLFLEEYNFGRYQTSGMWSQQRMNNFGNFSSTSDFGTISKWLASANLFSQMPFVPKIIGVFGDVGVFYDEKVNTMYNAGIGIRISKIFSVSFPLIQSANMGSDLFKNYDKQIRFNLRMNVVNSGLIQID